MKELVKRIARSFELEIRRYEGSDAARLQSLFAHYRIDTVLDVGASVGQYARRLRVGGYHGRIVSFEPLGHAHAELVHAVQGDPQWIAAPPLALGDREGTIEINVSANSDSSSALNMLDRHLAVAPGSRYVGKERVRLARLDSVAGEYLGPGASVFLKIDTQGFEAPVLQGATGILPRIRGIQLELSLVPLYEGQPLFSEMVCRVEKLGYSLHAVLAGLTEHDSGRMLQADGVFFRAQT